MANIDGLCPKCQKGQLNRVEDDRPIALRYANSFKAMYRIVYKCDNPDCASQNIAMCAVI